MLRAFNCRHRNKRLRCPSANGDFKMRSVKCKVNERTTILRKKTALWVIPSLVVVGSLQFIDIDFFNIESLIICTDCSFSIDPNREEKKENPPPQEDRHCRPREERGDQGKERHMFVASDAHFKFTLIKFRKTENAAPSMKPVEQNQTPPPHTDRVIIADAAPSCLRQLRGGDQI